MPLELAALLHEPRIIFGLICLALSLALLAAVLLRRWRDAARRSRRPDLRPRGLESRYRAPQARRRADRSAMRREQARPYRSRPLPKHRTAPLAGSALRPYRGGTRRRTGGGRAAAQAAPGSYRRHTGPRNHAGAARPLFRPPSYRGRPFWRQRTR